MARSRMSWGLFYIAQGIIRARGQRYTDEELIERLRTLFQSRGLPDEGRKRRAPPQTVTPGRTNSVR